MTRPLQRADHVVRAALDARRFLRELVTGYTRH